MFVRCRALLLSVAAVLLCGAAVIAGVTTPAAAAAPAAAADHVLTVLGAGPYRIGGSLDRLVTAGLITEPSAPDANGAQVATSLGDWPGELLLTFYHGRLAVLDTSAGTVRTAAGARVGMSFDQVDALYHGTGRLITGTGGSTAYVLCYPPMAMVFGDHPIRPGVGSITVGPAWLVLRNVTS
ncbi:hypothetical protein [Actinoplanes sp. L3-i22]|uniref:hypothetical protein n=1 Tax=Actinoplanes sp. L3-i22 TaxID=2836373 RepID=UPI001C76A79E|nr:hypothetical protein [Actinoplanes sp. L3-i22]BCY09452.1 hypothetical protein L3i22_045400 [Actinoplanes sp. L3-i22]